MSVDLRGLWWVGVWVSLIALQGYAAELSTVRYNAVTAKTGLILVPGGSRVHVTLVNGDACADAQPATVLLRNERGAVVVQHNALVRQGQALILDVPPSSDDAYLQADVRVGPRTVAGGSLCPINLTVQTLAPDGDGDVVGCGGVDLCTIVATGANTGSLDLVLRRCASPGSPVKPHVQANCVVEPALVLPN